MDLVRENFGVLVLELRRNGQFCAVNNVWNEAGIHSCWLKCVLSYSRNGSDVAYCANITLSRIHDVNIY